MSEKWNCNIIFIVDASESMQGVKIGTVNSAIEELVPELIDIAESNDDVSIYINVLKISDSVRWLFKEMCQGENFKWHDIHAGGARNIGMALDELNSKMSREYFFKENSRLLKPILFIMTDGTSEDDYREPMELLKKNLFFNSATRVGIAIGDGADREFLNLFTDCADQVITVYTSESLKRWIRFEEFDENERWD